MTNSRRGRKASIGFENLEGRNLLAMVAPAAIFPGHVQASPIIPGQDVGALSISPGHVQASPIVPGQDVGALAIQPGHGQASPIVPGHYFSAMSLHAFGR